VPSRGCSCLTFPSGPEIAARRGFRCEHNWGVSKAKHVCMFSNGHRIARVRKLSQPSQLELAVVAPSRVQVVMREQGSTPTLCNGTVFRTRTPTTLFKLGLLLAFSQALSNAKIPSRRPAACRILHTTHISRDTVDCRCQAFVFSTAPPRTA
jgi:hypothetical protein